METTKLIATLRSLDCEKCQLKEACHDMAEPCMLFGKAADRLEELTAELKEERHRHDRYVDFELAEAAELAKVKAERDELKAENEQLKSKVIENLDDWVDD